MASSLSQGTLCNVIFLASFLCLLLTPSIAKLERFKHNLKGNKPLNFLVIGDWGRKGEFNQSLVAKQMGIVGKKLDIDFVISTGDNFYDSGLTKVDDPAFYDSFVKIYTAPSLQKKWYSVLGNHDYRGVVEPQLSPKLKKKDPRWTCLRSFILEAEIVDFVFVDTTPFVNAYFDNPGKTTYDWKGVLPRKAYLSNLLKDVDSALEKSKAKWKIVVGHHTIKTAGYHNSTVELQDKLVPILKKYKVDAYINGHDHCLEHIIDQESGIHYLTSGAGSKAWRGVVKPMSPKELKLYYDGQGFMSVQITKINVDFVFYDIFGKVLHKSSITKNRKLQA